MATQSVHDVVDQSQSVGDHSPSDAPVTTTNTHATGGELRGESAQQENGVVHDYPPHVNHDEHHEDSPEFPGGEPLLNGAPSKFSPIDGEGDTTQPTVSHLEHNAQDEAALKEQAALEDGSVRSDTDTSRADGSVSEDSKGPEAQKPLKRPSAIKPVSFAKYQVTKNIAPGVAVKPVAEKVAAPASTASALQQTGRPRLVAKTTGILQQKTKAYKNVAPDPMQVWNKNRVTPQPSTKHLTDEELKQQYGIHMTSRIQGDGDKKEAQWADIDDDEDDWAPDTIEWTDGTKSTLNPADALPALVETPTSQTPPTDQPKVVQPSKILTSQFSSSIGPNAVVLKLGANVAKQQDQKAAAQQQKGSAEKPVASGSSSAPAAPPSKSPWAPLPPVDKVSPIVINPQMAMPPPTRHLATNFYGQAPAGVPASSPAKEMSADDFNRSWRESGGGQPRELYMPNSGRYEAVPEGRRRMSKHDGNFRAPAVLQRSNYGDQHAPAEPSAAFQTQRNSTDQARRRASSNISGGSGQMARRMSLAKSAEGSAVLDPVQSSTDGSVRPESKDGPTSQIQTPVSQAHSSAISYGFPPANVPPPSVTQEDIEAERARQKVLMREKIELARKRKIEEEARLEAEKKERVRLKLAELDAARQQKEQVGADQQQVKAVDTRSHAPVLPAGESLATLQSPPKPPLPQASGEPQQYGMMKVHPMNSTKKFAPPVVAQQSTGENNQDSAPVEQIAKTVSVDGTKISPPVVNGIRPGSENQRDRLQETASLPGTSPRVPKANSVGAEARSGWSDVRNDSRIAQTASLWAPLNHNMSNKTLGNGTFDQSLAGYAPQHLSSRGSSYSPPTWVNGQPPVPEKSPKPQFASHATPDTRLQLHPPASLPEQQDLTANSEVDSMYPSTKPAPIGPPQSHTSAHSWQPSPNMPHASQGVAAWNNFTQTAPQRERAEAERVQRELVAKREDELNTGIRSAPQYMLNETWKQVQLGDQAGQRANVGASQQSVSAQSISAAPSFGAVGSVPAVLPVRNSRFFPPTEGRRAVTYSHPEMPHSSSPPPAEEYGSPHPVYDGDPTRPVIRPPPEKPTVRLPPQMPVKAPTPPAPSQPLTWAARVSQPPPPVAIRSVSGPIAQHPDWQARFDGLFTGGRDTKTPGPGRQVTPVLAISSSSRELFDVVPSMLLASVSLPLEQHSGLLDESGLITSKDVEDEEDLFEDREAASVPLIKLPIGLPSRRMWPAVQPSMKRSFPPDVQSIDRLFMFDDPLRRPHLYRGDFKLFALIKAPGMHHYIKKDLPRPGQATGGPPARSVSASFPSRTAGRPSSAKLRNVSEQKSPAPVMPVQAPGSQRASTPNTPSSQPSSTKSTTTSSPAPVLNGNPRPPRTHHSKNWHGKQKAHGQSSAPAPAQVQAAH